MKNSSGAINEEKFDLRIDVFEGRVANPLELNPFQVIRGAYKSILDQLDHFQKNCPGSFTFFIRGNGNASWDQAERVYVDIEKQPQAPGSRSVNSISEEEIEKRVNDILAKKEEERRVKELEQKIAHLNTVGGKMEHLLDHYIETRFGNILGNQSRPIQGASIKPSDQDQKQASNLNDYELAFSILSDLFTGEEMLKIAQRLHDDPTTYNLVKSQFTT